MGALLSFGQFFAEKQRRILLLGLDAAGKTTLLYQLKLNEIVTTIPTIGFNVETIQHKNVSLLAWDVGSRDKARALWRHYFQGTDAVVFVVDSNDHERLGELRNEMAWVLADDELRDAVVLVLANKQDLTGACRKEKMVELLGLNMLRDRRWHIEETSVINKTGINEGLDWLVDQLRDGDEKKSSAWRYLTSPVCWLASWRNGKPKSALVT